MAFKMHFIPCEENGYYPNVLHGKRIALYAVFFVVVKLFIVTYALTIPFEAFTAPNVLAVQADRILALTNEFRKEKGLPELERSDALDRSASARAADMAAMGYLGPVSPNGDGIASFLGASGYAYVSAGENTAMGFAEPINVIDTWIGSQPHLMNLTDPDFRDHGIGMVAGLYRGVPTIFVVEHVAAAHGAEGVDATATGGAQSPFRIRSSDAERPATGVWYDRSQSRVQWAETGGRTKISVEAVIGGDVSSVLANVQGYPIDLVPDVSGGDRYVGSIFVQDSAANVFQTTVEPSIAVFANGGSVLRDTIGIDQARSIVLSPWQRYRYAKSWFTPITSVFSVAYWTYFAFFMFFSISLLVMVLVEFNKQYPAVVFRTIGFLTLIVALWLT